jgi:hypothetical protein
MATRTSARLDPFTEGYIAEMDGGDAHQELPDVEFGRAMIECGLFQEKHRTELEQVFLRVVPPCRTQEELVEVVLRTARALGRDLRRAHAGSRSFEVADPEANRLVLRDAEARGSSVE